MTTPVADFLRAYAASGTARFHMPGHKGRGPLGCEAWDLTEISGADSLYEAAGVIARSEENAAALFGSAATFYSTEGATQCIKAMLFLALRNRRLGTPSVILAPRNVHKSFVHAAALLDFEPVWLWPEEGSSLCACPITAEGLEKALASLPAPPAAVYVTSPDYLGNRADISALAEVCHARGTLLLTDNAHGAYLRFLSPSLHPLDQGADLTCDSAHKTLSVLTGGAYLHISKAAPAALREHARSALALFGSTSPSYLTLASLDLCNRRLSEEYPARLKEAVRRLEALGKALSARGWQTEPSDPLRLTLRAPAGLTGLDLADRLRRGGAECEYADRDFLVLMAAPDNAPEDFARVSAALGENRAPAAPAVSLPPARGERVLSVREALFAPQETVPAEESLGRVCGAPTVSCPPAVPIAVSGERIGEAALALFRYYGIKYVDVLQD
ncbi:MAG: aminotransferase class I/II-fold pyridoxal phosphate-dependent enzyme [Oscillibacter sp.]|nr:aminotransferase class I/II-fold pyridoxal phosphate-dependent enzyme [uncultured Oscillibacter sp.]MCI8971488.1 aminotransferase class I/II-fold pyridoxal phosphate-dependent enzyme [Oscillibacter sp.]